MVEELVFVATVRNDMIADQLGGVALDATTLCAGVEVPQERGLPQPFPAYGRVPLAPRVGRAIAGHPGPCDGEPTIKASGGARPSAIGLHEGG